MRNKIHHFRRRAKKPQDWSNWVTLLQYSEKHFISISTARLRIVRGEVRATKLSGRWYVMDT